jgi:formate/nitrite transporter FocA (FNT family)
MKHYRPISRTPAAATSALATKIEFKTSLSNTLVGGTGLLTDNFATIASGLFQNALNFGEIVTLVFEDIGDIFGGGGGGGGAGA